jgi:glycosyltransferase involved in cell wall biosynthesis
MNSPTSNTRHPESPISLIATVKNEADNIAALLESMLAQTRPPDEIVINDNWSTDDTPAIVQRYIDAGHPIRLVRGGFNIPSGRNNAIRHARHAVIASCDAGLTLPPRWLESITAPILRGEADVVGGFYEPAPESLWELALGATNYPGVDEIDPESFEPAGQSVAFTRAAWEAVGGYPEWADTCEDLIFDRALRQIGFRFAFAPEAAVRFRPRESLRAYWRQYFSYARGDGVGRLFPRRHASRYASYLIPLLLATATRRPRLMLLLLPVIAGRSYRPYRRLWPRTAHLPPRERLMALLLPPIIRVVGDIAKMCGYPAGVWRRLRDPQLTHAVERATHGDLNATPDDPRATHRADSAVRFTGLTTHHSESES